MQPAVIVGDSLTALGLVRSLSAHGVACVVCAWNARGPAQYARGVRRVACPPPAAGRALIDALANLARSFDEPPVLFVTDESLLLLIERWRASLDGPYRLTLPPSDQLAWLLSKRRLYELAATAGVPAPATWPLAPGDPPADLPYPVVVKPAQRVIWGPDGHLRSFRREFGGKALVAADRAALQRLAGPAHGLGFELLAQQRIDGEVSRLETAGVFRGRSGVRAVFTAHKIAQVPRDFGDGSIVEALPLSHLPEATWKLLDRLSYVGVADVEFKRDAAGQPLLLDANPRPWAWIELGTRCGVNLPYLLYCEAGGREPGPPGLQTPVPVSWCSGRALVRGVFNGGALSPGEMARSLRHGIRAARAAGNGSQGQRLARMLSSPHFWLDTLRAARGGDDAL